MYKLHKLFVFVLFIFLSSSVILAQTVNNGKGASSANRQLLNKVKHKKLTPEQKMQEYQKSLLNKKTLPKISVIPSSGGPDQFGYTYKSSLAPDGPAYNWVEIAPPEGGTGTVISYLDGVDDEIFYPLNIPFPFKFYNINYRSIGVSSNGMIAFSPIAWEYSNYPLPTDPSDANTGAFIAAFWDDLELYSDEHVYYLIQNDKIIIEYYNIKHFSGSSDSPITFEIILYSNGNILFQYRDVDFNYESWDFGGSATVGIQGSPLVALQYSYDNPVINNNLAIEFYAPSLTPLSGSGGLLVVNENSISIIDASTNTVYGPFLGDEIGGDNLGCAVTPDGTTAVVSDFDGEELYFIDLSEPTNPVLISTLPMEFHPEDLDITPDGKFVLITDGHYVDGTSRKIISVSMETRQIVQVLNLVNEAQCVAISPDGKTVLTGDYYNGSIDVFLINQSTGILTYQNSIQTGSNVNNITISPDGRNVVVSGQNSSTKILEINSPGNISLIGILPNDPGYIQSCVFNSDGSKAYLLQMDEGEAVYIYNVTQPNVFTYSGTMIPVIYNSSGYLFGINELALDPTGQYLYVSNYNDPGSVELIDLNSPPPLAKAQITMNSTGHYYIPTEYYSAGIYASKNMFTVHNITLSTPAGGETWQAGSAHNITWDCNGVNTVRIDLSTNSGMTWSNIATNVAANTWSYNWLISAVPYSTQCLIKISDALNPGINDISNPFTLIPGTNGGTLKGISLLQPNGGENWIGGTTQYIVFRKNVFFASVKLEYTTDDGATWSQILPYPLSGLTFYPWNVPLVNSDKCRIRVSNWSNPLMNAVSMNTFTIASSTMAMNYPNPFNPSTTIRFNMLKAGYACIKVYNSIGQQVAVLLNGNMEIGVHEVRFNAASYPSGIYYYEVEANGKREVKKMLYLK